MADRSFEEQVRKELEALRLTPDAGVWENVNAELRKEKKHRWLLWFIILTGLAGSAGLYYQFSQPAKDAGIAVQPQKAATQPSNTIAEPGSDDKSADRNNITEKKEPIPVQQNEPITGPGNTADRLSRSAKRTGSRTGQPEIQSSVTPPIVKPENSTVSDPGEKQPAVIERSAAVRKEITANKPEDHSGDKPGEQAKMVTATVLLPIRIQPDSGSKYTAQAKGDKTAVVKEQPVMEATMDSVQIVTQTEAIHTAASVVEQNKNKWKLFGSMDIGQSGEALSLRTAPMLAFAASPIGGGANFAPGNAPGTGGAAPPVSGSNAVLYRTPSRSGGFSFGLHLQALKTVGKKGSVGISAGYSYYSSTVGIGAAMYGFAALSSRFGNANTYYLSTDSTTYKNQYHFLSLNGDYYWNFRLGSATSLRWRMGGGIGLLLASDVLHFDQGRGILYEDRSILSTVHANLSTGLELGIGKSQSFFIGPQLSYFLSGSSFNVSSESKRHLFNAALRATIAIPKKKK